MLALPSTPDGEVTSTRRPWSLAAGGGTRPARTRSSPTTAVRDIWNQTSGGVSSSRLATPAGEGVVHHDVEAAVAIDGRGHTGLDRRPFGDVGDDALGGAARGADRLGHRLTGRGPPGGDDDGGALAGQLAGDALAHALTGAGDDGDPARQAAGSHPQPTVHGQGLAGQAGGRRAAEEGEHVAGCRRRARRGRRWTPARRRWRRPAPGRGRRPARSRRCPRGPTAGPPTWRGCARPRRRRPSGRTRRRRRRRWSAW